MESKIYPAIISIMNDVEAIGKNQKNAMQGFMYRGIDDLYNDLQPKFSKHGVFITSEVLDMQREERQSAKGSLLLWTLLKVKFTFFASDGSNISSVMEGEAMDSGDKGANKAMSVALKYCLMQLLLIPTEDLRKSDPDVQVHQPLAKDVKPPVKQGSFSRIIERLSQGELQVYTKAIETYSFTTEQKAELDLAHLNAKKLQPA